MQVKKKKVKLYIINDIAEPLRQSVLDSMQLYYAKEGNRISVWSATFPPASSESASYAGYVTMGGGDAELASLKRGLTSLFCDLATGAYGPGIGGGIYRVPNESPPKNMYLDKELNVAYAMIDTRRQVTEAISYGFYNFIPTGKNNRFFNWVASNPYVLIPSKFAPPLVFNDDPVPPKYSLVQQLVNVTLVDTGRYITFPPFPAGLDFLRLWKIYNLNSFPDKLIIQNEILLGMICFQFVEKMGQDLYSECIKRNNSSIEKAEPEDKLAVLMENLCMGTLRDKKIGQTPKNYLLPLALIDLYLDFPNMSGSSKDKQTFNGLFREGSFSISLLDAYYIERTAIKSAVDRANRMPGVKYRGSGEINLKELINAVWDQLMK